MNHSKDYWVQLLEKLSCTDHLQDYLGEVLEDLCTFLNYGAGFLYQADYTGVLHLEGSYRIYQTQLPQELDLCQLLPRQDLDKMVHCKTVYFRQNTEKDSLAQQLGELFEAKSLVLVPIVSPEENLWGMVGIVDRRGEVRCAEEDMDFTQAVLITLATFYKMQMYRQRVDTTQRALESILDHMGVDVYVNDFETHEVLYANQSMAAPYGGKDQLMGRVCWQALYDDMPGECPYCPQKKLLDHEGKPTKMHTWDYHRPMDGNWFRVLSAAFPWVDGRLAHVVSSVDITDNKNNEEIIRQLAEFDYITGLPNRFRLTGDFDNILQHHKDTGREGYVIFMDLDGFKKINDLLDHATGDEVLRTVGTLLQQSPMTRNRTYRYGGDEFVILCDGHTPAQMMDVVEFLVNCFSDEWTLESGVKVKCGASIGISHYPHDSTLSSTLLRQADLAMYESKRTIKGSVHFYNRGQLSSPKEYLEHRPCPQF